MDSFSLPALLKLMEGRNASDIHLQSGSPPIFRIRGELVRLEDFPPVNDEELRTECAKFLSEKNLRILDEDGTLDTAMGFPEIGRFRFSIYRQRGMLSLAGRRIPTRIPDFEALNLPPASQKIADFLDGLVLITGPTGSGKSSTLAAAVNYINRTRSCHILCIEDPIEFLFRNDKSVVTQREIGIDVRSFDTALRSAVRQDPDVILAGEIRDRATVEFALHGAETGHLVFATLHSSNATQTVIRLLNFFPHAEHPQLRKALSLHLRAILSQQLLPACKAGLTVVPAVEILFNTPMVGRLIIDNMDEKIPRALQSRTEGMQDFEQALYDLVEVGSITEEVALKNAENPHSLEMKFKGIFLTESGGIIS